MVTTDIDNFSIRSHFLLYAQLIERNIESAIDSTESENLLSRIFAHFGSHFTSDILFAVWKAGKFQYIGYDKQFDYEIPEEVLNMNATEIGYDELVRIREYSFGRGFCSGFAEALFFDAETMGREEKDTLIPYLDFLEDDDQEYWKTMF